MHDKILKKLEEGYRDAFRKLLLAKDSREIVEAKCIYIGYSHAFEDAMRAVGYTPWQTEEKCIAINNEIEEEHRKNIGAEWRV